MARTCERTYHRAKAGWSLTKAACARPRDGDQYNFTDPQSRIMKNSANTGFEQDYTAQIAVDQACLLIVGYALSNHPNDTQEAIASSALGNSPSRSLGHWVFGPATLAACAKHKIEASIATGRDPHHPN